MPVLLEASLRLCVRLRSTVMNSRQPETGLITMGMSHCLCRLVFFVCLKSPYDQNSRKRGQWLPAVKFTAHSRQYTIIMSASKAGQQKFDEPFSHCKSWFDHTNLSETQDQFWRVWECLITHKRYRRPHLYCCILWGRDYDAENRMENDSGDRTPVAAQGVSLRRTGNPFFGVSLLSNWPT